MKRINPYSLIKKQKSNRAIITESLKQFGFDNTRVGESIEKLAIASGKRPKVTFARKGVAALGIRAGAMSGVKVNVK